MQHGTFWCLFYAFNMVQARSNGTHSIAKSVSITIFTLLALSLACAVGFIAFVVYYRRYKILRASSWALTVLMCIGAVMSYLTAFMYGLDERYVASASTLTALCNIRIWSLCISFTLLFMPLFVKTYRIRKIFCNVTLIQTNIDNKRLFIYISICVLIDILLLTTYAIINPSQRIYMNNYGKCSLNEVSIDYVFYGLLLFWKTCELSFGVAQAIQVLRAQRLETTEIIIAHDK
eukprot:279690_1